MKTKILLPLLIVFQLKSFSQSATGNPNGPTFKFETEVMDYGTIPQNSNGEKVFKFTNIGKELLIISNVQSSCGCLVPTWPKGPVKPGASSFIKINYDTNRVGRFEKTITITSNADRPVIVLKVKGEVLPAPQKDSASTAPAEKH